MQKKIHCVVVGDIQTNCWLYPLDEELGEKQPCVIIDPGDDAERIISSLDKLKWVPRFILLTHGHFDHLMALPDLIDFFGKADGDNATLPKTGIHSLDAHYLRECAFSAHRNSFSAVGGDPAYIKSL